VELFTIQTSAVYRRVVEFRQELSVASMVHFVKRLRSDQSLKHDVGILQESMKKFVEHSENVPKCGAVDHIASSFGFC